MVALGARCSAARVLAASEKLAAAKIPVQLVPAMVVMAGSNFPRKFATV